MNLILVNEKYIAISGNQINVESHKHWMAQMIISKDLFEITVNGEKKMCTAILIQGNVEHECIFDEKHVFTILLEPTSDLSKSIINKFIVDKFNTEKGYYIFDNALSNLLFQFGHQIEQAYSANSEYNLIEKLLGILQIDCPKESKNNPYVQQVLHILSEEEGLDMSIEEISCKIGISSSRLSHVFGQEEGIPLKSYILNRKMIHAAQIFLKENNVTEAALASGFDSSSHFSVTCKKLTGLTPTKIIKDSRFLKVSE